MYIYTYTGKILRGCIEWQVQQWCGHQDSWTGMINKDGHQQHWARRLYPQACKHNGSGAQLGDMGTIMEQKKVNSNTMHEQEGEK